MQRQNRRAAPAKRRACAATGAESAPKRCSSADRAVLPQVVWPVRSHEHHPQGRNAAPDPQASVPVHLQLHRVAMMLETQGDVLRAKEKYLEALQAKPDFAEAHCNLGNTYKLLGHVSEAEQSYRTALTFNPSLAEAMGNLGSVCYEKGDRDTAKSLFHKALEIQPELPDAWNHLGNLTRDNSEPETAILYYKRALSIQPGHPHALNNMGNALKDVGRTSEALGCYVAAIRVLPTSPAPHTNLAALYKEHGDLDKALFHYQEVLRLCPTSAGAYSNIATLYKDSFRLNEALALYGLGLSVDPNHTASLNSVGTIFKDWGRLEEAMQYYCKALMVSSDALGVAEVLSNFAHTLMFLCDYTHRDVVLGQVEAMTREQLAKSLTPSVQPFHALVYPLPLPLITEISLSYGKRCELNVAGQLQAFKQIAKPVVREAGSRIRVGYVSSDFINHPLAHLMQSCFGMHDRSKLEVFCFSLSVDDKSSYFAKISSEVEHFYDVSQMQIFDIAKLINSLQIHVLFNLNGYTKGARTEVFAFQPSPVQVSYMGFCGSMGAKFMQYMVTDVVACPPAVESIYTEKLVFMPHSYFVNDHKQSNPEVLHFKGGQAPGLSRTALGIPEDKIVLCNFNQLYKIDPDILDVWCDLLKGLPNAVLWLLRFPKAGEAGIRKEVQKRGVANSQIIFTDIANKNDHINRGMLADLFVDTLQCNAHTTACDILWSGTPMVTMPQTKMSCRVAASLLTALGCPHLVQESLEEYSRFVMEMVTQSKRELVDGEWRTLGALEQLRAEIEGKRVSEPLFDTQRWVQNLEVGIELMWEQHENGKEPEHLRVRDVRDGGCTPDPVLSERVLGPLKGREGQDADKNPVLDKGVLENIGRRVMEGLVIPMQNPSTLWNMSSLASQLPMNPSPTLPNPLTPVPYSFVPPMFGQTQVTADDLSLLCGASGFRGESGAGMLGGLAGGMGTGWLGGGAVRVGQVPLAPHTPLHIMQTNAAQANLTDAAALRVAAANQAPFLQANVGASQAYVVGNPGAGPVVGLHAAPAGSAGNGGNSVCGVESNLNGLIVPGLNLMPNGDGVAGGGRGVGVGSMPMQVLQASLHTVPLYAAIIVCACCCCLWVAVCCKSGHYI